MRVICRTNLDLSGEDWPVEMPAVPVVGDRIRSATKHGTFQLELKVVCVTWIPDRYSDFRGQPLAWVPEIELHMTDWQCKMICKRRVEDKQHDCCNGSICAFYHWYAPLIGSTASAFI